MNLGNFLGDKKKKEFKVVVKNKDVEIKSDEEKIVFNFKDKSKIEDYSKFLFFAPSKKIVTEKIEDLEVFFENSLKDGVEGIMIKSLKAEYKSGSRVGAMTKVKELKEEVDVVILGAEYGTGRRAGFYSSFVVGVRNELTDEFLEVGKVASGVKEVEGENISIGYLTELLKPLKVSESGNRVNFSPQIVLEIKYQDVIRSSKYNSGFAFRFPKIFRLREDKGVDEIATLSELSKLI